MHKAEIQLNDHLQIEAQNDHVVLSKPFRHKTLRERVEESGIPITVLDEYDWGEPQGDEV